MFPHVHLGCEVGGARTIQSNGIPGGCERLAPPKTKKADMAEHPKAFDHVGLLVNGLPGTAGLPFI
jgi:hypothetical protein